MDYVAAQQLRKHENQSLKACASQASPTKNLNLQSNVNSFKPKVIMVDRPFNDNTYGAGKLIIVVIMDKVHT